MSETWRSEKCLMTCWAVAALAGLFAVLRVTPEFPVLAALMFGGGLAVLLGVALTRIICLDKGMPRNLGLALGFEIDDTYRQDGLVPETGPRDAHAPAKPGPEVAQSTETQPAALSQPHSSGLDDLKKIKGIGPKLETLCHRLGIYHFDQIAGWNTAEVAWMDAHLEGFRGRVTRDGWVDQAKALANGPVLESETQETIRDKDSTRGAGQDAATPDKRTGGD